MTDLVTNEDKAKIPHLRALGKRVLSEANHLKRTPEALAREIGSPMETIEAVIAGTASIDTVRGVLGRMSEVYPVSLADLWIDPDDTNDGVLIMSAEHSAATSRIFQRRDCAGAFTDYYEYRDTAMSRLSPFKPEWILEMRCVEDADPNNPDVAYNNGHLMHQCTFFIGDVNFYWAVDGKRYCAQMSTGDSNYITPFVPHSFTSRDPAKPGLIIAVTYAGQVHGALSEFGRIGAGAAEELAGNLDSAEDAFHARLTNFLAAESLSADNLRDRLVNAGIDRAMAEELLAGARVPLPDEIDTLAACLHLRAEDLMVTQMETGERVVVTHIRDTQARAFPSENRAAYRLTELARTRHQANLKGFEVAVLNCEASPEAVFRHGLHEYVYNYGDTSTIIFWGDGKQAPLAPGDSAYIHPMVSHGFLTSDGAVEGRLVVIRIPGALGISTINEYATFPVEGRSRVAGETQKWF